MNEVIDEIKGPSYFLSDYLKPDDFVKSPFRYPGGKFYALKHIMPFIDCIPHDEFREPFVGGGSVFFGKKKAAVNWINDLESDMIDVYNAFSQEEAVVSFGKLLLNEIATRERHEEIKKLVVQTDFQKAFKTYYLNRTSYCGIIHKPAWGYSIGKSSPPQNWLNFIEGAYKKLQNVQITSLDFEQVIRAEAQGEKVLLYLDPPYYNADQKRAYTKPFEEADHVRLMALLRETAFKFCLSYDDCEEVRELYSWANIYERKWLYNTANKKGTARTLGNELIITNYNVTLPLLGL
jgi:DNA adenine methylase